jgi:hypothetical protein
MKTLSLHDIDLPHQFFPIGAESWRDLIRINAEQVWSKIVYCGLRIRNPMDDLAL